MYVVNQCSNPRYLVSPRDETIKISVLPGKSIFTVDSKAFTGDVDIQKVRSGVLE